MKPMRIGTINPKEREEFGSVRSTEYGTPTRSDSGPEQGRLKTALGWLWPVLVAALFIAIATYAGGGR